MKVMKKTKKVSLFVGKKARILQILLLLLQKVCLVGVKKQLMNTLSLWMKQRRRNTRCNKVQMKKAFDFEGGENGNHSDKNKGRVDVVKCHFILLLCSLNGCYIP